MAAINSKAVTGVWSDPNVWVGGVVPGALDAATLVAGADIQQDIDVSIGSKLSGIGNGITVKNGATFRGAAHTLTASGFDTTTNRAIYAEPNSNVLPGALTILVDAPSDWGTVVQFDGNLTTNGTVFDIPNANKVWNNAITNYDIGTISAFPFRKDLNIYCYKLSNAAGDFDPGPVSNAAGSGIGSFGDSSFAVATGGFSGSTSNEVASFALLLNAGDFYMDYKKAVVYYVGSNTLTMKYSWKFGTWFSYGILCTANNATSAISITGNTTIRYAGRAASNQSAESTQGGLMIDDKYAPAISATQGLTINGLVFEFCARPLHYYQSDIVGSTAAHPQAIQNVTFNNCRYNGFGGGIYSFSSGLINHGYGCYVNYSGIVLNSYCPIYTPLSRGSVTDTSMVCTGAATDGTGHVIVGQTTPHCGGGAVRNSFQGGTSITLPLVGFGGNTDTCAFQEPGGTGADHNIYSNCFLRAVHRVARLDNGMTVTHNYWDRTYHHGIVHRSGDGYMWDYICEYNTGEDNYDSSLSASDPSGGGWTAGYNRCQIIDGRAKKIKVRKNTFDLSNRSCNFNDFENCIVGVIGVEFVDNIYSNNQQGIYSPAGDNTNQNNLAFTRSDFNNDYNNPTNATNIKQGTFMQNGVEYNGQAGRNAKGCYLMSPSYALPYGTNNSLVLTVTGVNGTNKAINVAWGSGTPVNFVAFQGTCSGAGTNPAGGPATVIDATLHQFPTTGSKLKGYWVLIVAGTGAGQWGIIKDNDASTLTVVVGAQNDVWPVNTDATSVYLILKQHQVLADLATTGTVLCGVAPDEILTANNTYTDSNITVAKNYPGTSGANNGVNPNYVSTTNFAPKNTALKGTASDGGDIGAWPVQSSSGMAGFNPGWLAEEF